MPIYEYECGSCGVHEVMQRITEDPLTVCETCGSPVRRLLSRGSFALKGGGWYKDLYASAGAKPAEGGTASTDANTTPASSTDSGGASAGSGAAPTPAPTGGPAKAEKAEAASSPASSAPAKSDTKAA